MDARRRAARGWVAIAIVLLLVALCADVGHSRGWIPDSVAVPLALLGVVGFAAATVRATFVKRSLRR